MPATWWKYVRVDDVAGKPCYDVMVGGECIGQVWSRAASSRKGGWWSAMDLDGQTVTSWAMSRRVATLCLSRARAALARPAVS